jgi:hypothetical protein
MSGNNGSNHTSKLRVDELPMRSHTTAGPGRPRRTRFGKVFIFGDDHCAMLMRVSPDWRVVASGEIDIKNVIGLMRLFAQP